MPILYDLTSRPPSNTSMRNAGMLTTIRESVGTALGACLSNASEVVGLPVSEDLASGAFSVAPLQRSRTSAASCCAFSGPIRSLICSAAEVRAAAAEQIRDLIGPEKAQ